MSSPAFIEQNLYYQYEQVFWEGSFQPIISTWVYLGKQVLANRTTPEGTVGHVFAFWHHEFKEYGWHATSVTQTFWTPEMATQRMLSWNDFKTFILTLSREPCPSCRPNGPVGTDDLVSLAKRATASSDCGNGGTGGSCDRPSFVEKSLYYHSGLLSLEPRMIICGTRLCERPGQSVWHDRDGNEQHSWYFSDIFSRSLGVEILGIPVHHCRPSPIAISTWDKWCAGMPQQIDVLENYEQRIKEAREQP